MSLEVESHMGDSGGPLSQAWSGSPWAVKAAFGSCMATATQWVQIMAAVQPCQHFFTLCRGGGRGRIVAFRGGGGLRSWEGQRQGSSCVAW